MKNNKNNSRKHASKKTAKKPKVNKPFRVVVKNSPVHTLDHVVKAIQSACGMSYQDATKAAQTVHIKGKATVFSGTRTAARPVRAALAKYPPDTFAASHLGLEPAHLTVSIVR